MLPVCTLSPLDSGRFSLKIARANGAGQSFGRRMADEIGDEGYDLVIFRSPAGEVAAVRELAAHGFNVVHADTLVYYGIDLPLKGPSHRMPHGVTFQAIEDRHLKGVAEVAKNSFGDYRGHYAASEFLSPTLVRDGYVDWAIRYATGASDTQIGIVMLMDEQVIGFVVAERKASENEIDIVLNAVSPPHRNLGVYTAGLVKLLESAQSLNFRKAVISTQVWNYAVQRAWSRVGLRIEAAFDTFHVTAAGRALTLKNKEVPE